MILSKFRISIFIIYSITIISLLTSCQAYGDNNDYSTNITLEYVDSKTMSISETFDEYQSREDVIKSLLEDYRYVINKSAPTLSAQTAGTLISSIDKKVISAINTGDFLTLKNYIHPVNGVRISCFNEASTSDIILYTETFSTDLVYIWGYEWGSGYRIQMSVAELFETIIYYKKYILYNPIYNPHNLQDYADGNEYVFYDKCISVLYLYEGNEASTWLDWSGLKLIYQVHEDGNWYLTGIIHCERIM
ncbi:MAG: hypothetical protein ACRDBO_04940 [Lachnospiraceae bacterium]